MNTVRFPALPGLLASALAALAIGPSAPGASPAGVSSAATFAPSPAGTATESGKLFVGRTATLYYEIRGGGAGTPLVVVNGGPGFDHGYLHCSDAWDVLAQRRPVLFYDQRGNGRSPGLRKGQSCTLGDQIEDLEALLASLHWDHVELLGHSWGGYLVMAYAARHPQRIKHLMICDSAAPKWSDTVFLFKDIFPEGIARQEAVAFAEALGDTAAVRADLREYFGMLFYSPEKRDAFLARNAPYVFRKEINEGLNADLQKYDLNPELPKFRFPTLVMCGRYDINVAPSVAWKIHRAIPDSRFVVFESSGHLPFYEERDNFVRTVEEFLAAR